MSDIKLTMLGDASGAADALKHVGHAASELHEVLDGALKGALGSTVTTFSSLETVAEKAAEVVKDFFKESIEDYARAERATNQLRAAAGTLTAAFQEQAETMERTLHVKTEDIEHMQMLLLRYGAAPAEIEKTTKAVLDYAAATGQDANSALMMMIRGVESGHGSLGRMGVQFKATGDFAKDLAAATQALGDKFGGAAEVDANGLAGRAHGVALAMENLRKATGSWFDDLDKRVGLLDGLARGLDTLTKNAKQFGVINALGNAVMGGGFVDTAAQRAGLVDLPPERAEWDPTGKTSGGLPTDPLFGGSEKQKKETVDHHASMLQLEATYQRKHRDMLIAAYEQDEKDEEKHDEAILKTKRLLYDGEVKNLEEIEKVNKESLRKQTQEWEQGMKEIRRMLEEQKRENDKMAHAWISMGQQIGSALISGIVNGIKGGGPGGKGGSTQNVIFGVMMDVFHIVFNMLLSSIGGGFATPATDAFFAKSKEVGSPDLYENPDTRHTGGWIERFHGGGPVLGRDERLAILQTGEHVASRAQVASAGGMAAVDSMFSGRGGGVTNIYAFDSSTMLDFVSGGQKMDRAMINAARTGRGALLKLFGGGR